MNAPVVLAPEFIGVLRHLINNPPAGPRLSSAGRALFYIITAARLLQRHLPDYDKELENSTKLRMEALEDLHVR